MPWRTLCGFPPTAEATTLRLPFKEWRPDTVITDTEGNEMFVLLDQTQEMRSYEAIFGDLEGRRLCCVKRHLRKQIWKDGYYLCTYEPNYRGQRALTDRDVDNKRVYPFSYVQVSPMKGRFYYRMFDNCEGIGPPVLKGENPWLGFMAVCATPAVRTGRWACKFKRVKNGVTAISVDQWKNRVVVGPGVDLLAALCIAYVFDRFQCQPLITVLGRDPEDDLEIIDDEHTINSRDSKEDQRRNLQNSHNNDNNSNNDNNDNKPYEDYEDDDSRDPFAIDSDGEDDLTKGTRRTLDTVGNKSNRTGITTNTRQSHRTANSKKPVPPAVAESNVTVPDLLDTSNNNENRQPDEKWTSTSNVAHLPSSMDQQDETQKNNDPYTADWLHDDKDKQSRLGDKNHGNSQDESKDPYSDDWLQDENHVTTATTAQLQPHITADDSSFARGFVPIDTNPPMPNSQFDASNPFYPQSSTERQLQPPFSYNSNGMAPYDQYSTNPNPGNLLESSPANASQWNNPTSTQPSEQNPFLDDIPNHPHYHQQQRQSE